MFKRIILILVLSVIGALTVSANTDWRDLVAAKGAAQLRTLIAQNQIKPAEQRNYYFELPFTDDFLACEGGVFFKQFRSKLPHANLGDGGNPGYANCYMYGNELTTVNNTLAQINSRNPKEAEIYTFAVYGIPVYFLNDHFNDTTIITNSNIDALFRAAYDGSEDSIRKMNTLNSVQQNGFRPEQITDPKNNDQVIKKAYSDAEYIMYKILQQVVQPGKNIYMVGLLKYDAYNTIPQQGEFTQPALSYDNLYITKSYGNFSNGNLFNQTYKSAAAATPLADFTSSPSGRLIRLVSILDKTLKSYYDSKQFIASVDARVNEIISCINSIPLTQNNTVALNYNINDKYLCFHDVSFMNLPPSGSLSNNRFFIRDMINLDRATFSFLSTDTRIKLLKLLLMFVGNPHLEYIPEEQQRLVVHLLSTVGSQSDAQAVLAALNQPNELYTTTPGTTPKLLYLVIKGLYDTDEAKYLDENYLFNSMAAISRLVLKSRNDDLRKLADDLFNDNTTPNYIQHIKWSDHYTGIRSLFSNGKKSGDRHYSVAISPDNTLNVKAYEHTWHPSSGGSGGISPTTGIPSAASDGSYTEELLGSYNFTDPFKLIYFSNTSSLELLAYAESGLNIVKEPEQLKSEALSENGGKYIHVAPAIFLEYARQKRSIDNSAANTRIFLDGIAIVLPFARIGTLERLAIWARALVVGTDVANALRATLDIAITNGALKNNPKFTTLLHTIDKYLIAINIASAGTEIAALKNARYFAAQEKEGVYRYFQELNKNDVLDEINRVLNEGTSLEKQEAAAIIRNGNKVAENMEEAFGADWMNVFRTAPLPGSPSSVFSELNDAYFTRMATTGSSTKFFAKGSGDQLLAEFLPGQSKLQVTEFKPLSNDIRNYKLVNKVGYEKKVANGWQKVEDGAFVMATKTNGTSCLIEGLCFTGSTLVATDDGAKPMSEINPGDLVYTMSFELNKPVLSSVTAIIQQRTAQLMRIVARGDTVYCTPGHPFYTVEDGWKAAGELQKGWQVFTLSGTPAMITSVEPVTTDAAVYNFEVADNHNYFVGRSGLLAHNTFVCDDYIAAVATRLGLDYNALETIVRGLEARILAKAKNFSLTEKQVVDRLRKLADANIGRARAKAFFEALQAKPQLVDDFADKVLKYETFIDEILEQPVRLEAWVALKNVANREQLDAWAEAYLREGSITEGSFIDVSYQWKRSRMLYFMKGSMFEDVVTALIKTKNPTVINLLAQHFGVSAEEFLQRYVIFTQAQLLIPKAGTELGYTSKYTAVDILIGKREVLGGIVTSKIENYYNFDIKLSINSPSTPNQLLARAAHTENPEKLYKVRSRNMEDEWGNNIPLGKDLEIKLTSFKKIVGDGNGEVNGIIGPLTIN